MFAPLFTVTGIRKTAITDLTRRFYKSLMQPLSRFSTIESGCVANGIKHRLTKINHPWTNGRVERMNRTLKKPRMISAGPPR
jgi:transposase InsO family protein